MTPAEELAQRVQKGGKPIRPRKKLRNNIRALRESLKLRLSDVAAECGCSSQHMSKLELGVWTPNVVLALRIARFYGRSIESLWTEAE